MQFLCCASLLALRAEMSLKMGREELNHALSTLPVSGMNEAWCISQKPVCTVKLKKELASFALCTSTGLCLWYCKGLILPGSVKTTQHSARQGHP